MMDSHLDKVNNSQAHKAQDDSEQTFDDFGKTQDTKADVQVDDSNEENASVVDSKSKQFVEHKAQSKKTDQKEDFNYLRLIQVDQKEATRFKSDDVSSLSFDGLASQWFLHTGEKVTKEDDLVVLAFILLSAIEKRLDNNFKTFNNVLRNLNDDFNNKTKFINEERKKTDEALTAFKNSLLDEIKTVSEIEKDSISDLIKTMNDINKEVQESLTKSQLIAQKIEADKQILIDTIDTRNRTSMRAEFRNIVGKYSKILYFFSGSAAVLSLMTFSYLAYVLYR